MSEMNSQTNQQERESGFQRLWNRLVAPSKGITDPSEQRSARLATAFLLAISILDFIGGLARVPRVGLVEAFAGPIGISLVPLLITYFISRTRWYRIAVFLFATSYSSLAYVAMITQGNEVDYGAQIFIYVPVSLIVASSFLSAPAVFLLVGLNIGAYISIPAFGVALPENIGAQAGMITVTGVVLMLLSNFRKNSEEIRLNELRAANRELESLTIGLEQRVAERTKALETSAEISRSLAAFLDPTDLAGEVVNQIQTTYDYYYAQIYLYDDPGENLVLTAGTGEAGKAMMERGHSLPKGQGLVGRAAEGNSSVLVSDTSQALDWLPNDLLPDTKTEATIPIAIGTQVFGVLDVQDDSAYGILPEDITLLESLAAQVAISLQNAQQYSLAEEARQDAQSLVDYAAEGIAILDLETLLWTEPNENFASTFGMSPKEITQTGPGETSPPTQPDGRDSGEKAEAMINTAMEQGSHRFEWVHLKKDGTPFDCEIGLVRLPGDRPRLRQSILDITERKRLEEDIAQRARQQTMLNLITQKIQSATTIEEAMQVAARELGNALGKRKTMVALDPESLGLSAKEEESKNGGDGQNAAETPELTETGVEK